VTKRQTLANEHMYDPAHARSRTVQPMGGNLKPDLTLKTCLVYRPKWVDASPLVLWKWKQRSSFCSEYKIMEENRQKSSYPKCKYGILSILQKGLLCFFRTWEVIINSDSITWCFSDHASWIDYILITNLMHRMSQTSKTPYQQPPPHSQFSLKLCTDRPPRTLVESDSTICCMYITVSSWRWALKARNM